MDRAEYLNAIREFYYQGEVGGEAFGLRAMAAETDPVKRYKWGCLAQLETETKARLRPHLMRLGVDIAEADVSATMERTFKGWAEKAWDVKMREVVGVTDYYLGKFREIAAAAPPEDAELAESMVAHELAINTFARKELAGDTETSVDDMVAQLRFPLPRP